MSFEEMVGRRVADAQEAAASRENQEAALHRQYESLKPQAQAAFQDTVQRARDYLAEQSPYDLTLAGGTGWYLGDSEGVRAFISTDGQLNFGNVHVFSGNWSPVGEYRPNSTTWMKVIGVDGPIEQIIPVSNPAGITPPSGKTVNLATWGGVVDGPANMIEVSSGGYGLHYPRAAWPMQQYFFDGRIDFDTEGMLWVTYQERVRDRTHAVAFDSWLADRVAWRLSNAAG